MQVTYKEIDEMIKTVDKNGDGKINYSEFRVSLMRVMGQWINVGQLIDILC